MADEDERLVDITRCSLCIKTSRVPKRLPCFHILCMNCFQTSAPTSRTHSDEILPCPVCNTEFSLPAEGLGAFQTDSFVQRLTKVNDILELSSGKLLCDACQGDSTMDTADVAPSADMFCAKCCMRLCKYCCRLHEKSKLTRDHTLVNLRNQTISKELLEIVIPNNCEKHTKEQLKMYCSDCKFVVCSLCYMENHQNHCWSEIELAANQFRAQIESYARSLNCCRQKVLNKIKLLQKEKSDAIGKTWQVETSVLTAKHGLKRLVDTHADALIEQIKSLKDGKLAEIKTDYEKFTKELSTLKSCLKYAEELDRKGSPGDVCQVVDDFAKRAVELEKLKECLTSRHVKEFQIDFKQSKLKDILTKCGGNPVGKIQVDQAVKSQDEDGEYWLQDILSKTEKLQLELNKEKLTTHSLKSSIEQLQQHLNGANLIIYKQSSELESQKRNSASLQEVIDKQKLVLEKEKANCKCFRSTIEKKNEELSEERSIRDHQNKELFDELKKTTTLQTMADDLNEKLYKETQSNMNLQKIIDKQKQELDTEKLVQISLEAKVEKLQKELKECRFQDREIPQVHTKPINQLNVAQEKAKNEWEWGNSVKLPEKEKNEWGAIAKLPENDINEQLIADKKQMLEILNDKGKHLEQHLEFSKQKGDSVATMTQGTMPRNEDIVLTHTITSTFAGNNTIMGLTILGNELFLIHRYNSSIEIFDSTNFSFKKKFDINGLSNPQDIVSCPKYQCLYIMDLPRIKYIMRLGSTGNLISRWRTGKDGGRLSVTKNSTLLVTFYYTNQLREYTCDGEMLHQVKFSEDSGIAHPWHAVELKNDHFVVCFGCRTDIENKICIVDKNGTVLLSFGGKRGSSIGQLNCPLYLATDDEGNIVVADQNNSRLLLLSPELKFIRELVSINANGATRRLSKFYLQKSKGKLFLAHNGWDWNLSPGKILVFDVDKTKKAEKLL